MISMLVASIAYKYPLLDHRQSHFLTGDIKAYVIILACSGSDLSLTAISMYRSNVLLPYSYTTRVIPVLSPAFTCHFSHRTRLNSSAKRLLQAHDMPVYWVTCIRRRIHSTRARPFCWCALELFCTLHHKEPYLLLGQ